jgi:heat shock protein HslJ
MSAWLLVFAAATAAQAYAPASAADYFASGSEPFWGLEIRGRGIKFIPHDGSVGDGGIAAVLPRRRPLRNGYRLVTPGFTVLVRHEICEDEGERLYRDTVRVRKDGRTYAGCGGTLLPPTVLANTDWRIEAIGGARVGGDTYVMQFYEGRINAQAGCNRLSGAYTQRGDRLAPGPIMVTRMACPGPRMAHERAVMRVLGGPVRISYPAGDVLVLTGSGGTIRLRRV